MKVLFLCFWNLDLSALSSVQVFLKEAHKSNHPPSQRGVSTAETRADRQSGSLHFAVRNSPFAYWDPKAFTWSAKAMPMLSALALLWCGGAIKQMKSNLMVLSCSWVNW